MKVAILIGSESDRDVIERANPFFEYFGISFDLHVMSEHRNPSEVQKFSVDAKKNGYKVIIAGAGLAAHLPGVVASKTIKPVIA